MSQDFLGKCVFIDDFIFQSFSTNGMNWKINFIYENLFKNSAIFANCISNNLYHFFIQARHHQQSTRAPLERSPTAQTFLWKANVQIVIQNGIAQGVKLHREINAHLVTIAL